MTMNKSEAELHHNDNCTKKIKVIHIQGDTCLVRQKDGCLSRAAISNLATRTTLRFECLKFVSERA